jgi:hypothetical protein
MQEFANRRAIVDNPSPFQKLRVAAGYKTVPGLARDLRLPNTTVYRWDKGEALPENLGRARYVADFFTRKGIPLTPLQVLELFRKGTPDNLRAPLAKGRNRHGDLTGLLVGDPCPRAHGCNGIIVLPTEGGARSLRVELTCETCPKKWTERIADYHPKQCRECFATPRSVIGEMLERCGSNVAELAQEIGRPIRTVSGWQAGGRPKDLETLYAVKFFFNRRGIRLTLVEALTLLWKQTVGDPCPKHGASCRGVLTPPIDGKAQDMDIMIPCQDCGTPKFYRGDTRYQHHDQQFCRDCGIKARRKPRKPGPAVLPRDPSRVAPLECVGRRSFKARKARHAENCPRHTEKPRRRLKWYGTIKHPDGSTERIPGGPRTIDDGIHAFIDADRGEWRSKECAIAALDVHRQKEEAEEFLTGWKEACLSLWKEGQRLPPREDKDDFFKRVKSNWPQPFSRTLPEIESKAQLTRLRKICYAKWSYVDHNGKEHFFDRAAAKGRPHISRAKPETRQRDQAHKDALKRIPAEMRHVAGGLVMRWTPKSTGKLVPEAYWELRETDPARAQDLLGGKNLVAMKIDVAWLICSIPATVQGICQFCHTLVIDWRRLEDHPTCRREGIILPDPHEKGGSPFSLEDLPKHFCWMILNKLRGKSLRVLAEEFKFSSRNTIHMGIQSIWKLLPERKRVDKRFHPMISLIQIVGSRSRLG